MTVYICINKANSTKSLMTIGPQTQPPPLQIPINLINSQNLKPKITHSFKIHGFYLRKIAFSRLRGHAKMKGKVLYFRLLGNAGEFILYLQSAGTGMKIL